MIHLVLLQIGLVVGGCEGSAVSDATKDNAICAEVLDVENIAYAPPFAGAAMITLYGKACAAYPGRTSVIAVVNGHGVLLECE